MRDDIINKILAEHGEAEPDATEPKYQLVMDAEEASVLKQILSLLVGRASLVLDDSNVFDLNTEGHQKVIELYAVFDDLELPNFIAFEKA